MSVGLDYFRSRSEADPNSGCGFGLAKRHELESRMSPQEYRAALDELGLSQLAAGRWLGVSPKTAQNYATVGPSGPAARAIRLVLDMSPAARKKALAG